MQRSIEKVMHLGIDFWKDFGGFVEEKSSHVGIKIKQKSIRRGSEGLLAARPENGRWDPVFWDPLGAVLGSFLGPSWRLGRRLGPTLVVLVRLKIDAKIDRKSDASWKRILEGFWWIVEGRMEACWH